MSFAENWKALGTLAYKEGNYDKALQHYSQAIELDPQNAVYFVNRSLTYAAMNQWHAATKDAREAVILDKKYLKAHFRLVKGLIELRQFREARLALNYAFNECGEQKEFKALEQDLFSITLIPVRPKSTDFEIIKELGRGNFTQIFKTYYKPTKQIFAVKTIEKQTIDRMKKRHPNINNEILMEKRVLNKLSHPGIEILFNTFQDYGTLYYQLEYVPGHDLWYHLHELLPFESEVGQSGARSFASLPYFSCSLNAPTPDDDEYWEELSANGKKKKTYFSSSFEEEDGENGGVAHAPERLLGAQLGLPWDLAIFYLQELLLGLEYLHQRGIVHRDLKPENILIHARTGHLKLIDFGTAKDLQQTDLNGPEFVGTPEYMSPNTVASAKNSTIETDLWAVGVIAYQLLLGKTPYAAASPYLTFLRIKRNFVLLPSWLPPQCSNLLSTLLIKDPVKRLTACSNLTFSTPSATPSATPSESPDKPWHEQVIDQLPSLSYDKLRGLPIFAPSFRRVMHGTAHYTPTAATEANNSPATTATPLELPSPEAIQAMKTLYATDLPQDVKSTEVGLVRIPSLHELCLHAVTETCVQVGELIAAAGGVRPTHIPWVTAFNLTKLSPLDRGRIFHRLVLKKKAQIPTVARLFASSVVEMKCSKSSVDRKDGLGFTYALQGHALQGHHAAIVSTYHDHTTFTTPPPPPAPTTAATGTDGTSLPPTPPPQPLVQEEETLKQTIGALNKLRPKFVLFFGPFLPTTLPLHTVLPDADATGGEDAVVMQQAREQLILQATERFRRLVARVSDTIGVFFVPAPHDLAHYSSLSTNRITTVGLETNLLHPVMNYIPSDPTAFTPPPPSPCIPHLTYTGLLHYRRSFGADYYAFWYEGSRYLVLNSSLFFVSSPPETTSTAEIAKEKEKDHQRLYHERLIQEIWLEEELEQGKLCGTNVILCSYHPWYFQEVEEEDLVWITGKAAPVPATQLAATDSHSLIHTQNIPLAVRRKFVKRLQHHKIKYHFTAPLPAVAATTSTAPLITSLPRPFAQQKEKKKQQQAEEEVVEEPVVEEEEEEQGEDKKTEGETEEVKKEEEENEEKGNESDSDDSDFENLEEDYEGPEILPTPSLFTPTSSALSPAASTDATSVRFVYFEENKHCQYLCDTKSQLPSTMNSLLSHLQSLSL